jgi:hypothetical protein
MTSDDYLLTICKISDVVGQIRTILFYRGLTVHELE